MIEYSTDTRQAGAEANGRAEISPEELLKERRAFYYGLVEQIFGKEPKGRDKTRAEFEGLSLSELMAMYTAMRTSREIDHMEVLLQRSPPVALFVDKLQ